MGWEPANISAICQYYPSIPTCQSSVLAFMVFVIQHFGQSYDNNYTDKNSKDVENDEFDFVIVGGGTAACVLANRLSEIPEWKVLLLEAGDEEPLVADVPGLYGYLPGSSVDWNYQTQPEPYACNFIESKVCRYIQGKVLGGSSTINAMIYNRGNPEDFNHWASLGNDGWSYDDVLPYFLKSEDSKLFPNSSIHSTGGYVTIDHYPYAINNSDVIMNAWKELGYTEVDYNGYKQIGVGEEQIANINGARLSMNGAFIRPIRGRRPNLTIKTNHFVTKILIDPNTKRAFGVEYSDNSVDKKILKKVYAKKEVILSTGTIASPKLLKLSGIGSAEELKKVGIDVVQDLPGVGENLQDHVILPSSIGFWKNFGMSDFNADNMKNDLVNWQNTHTGPLSSIGIVPLVVFDKLKYQQTYPAVQYFHTTSTVSNIELTESMYSLPTYIPMVYHDSIAVGPILLHPKSRGTIKLNEIDPVWSQPVIRFNSLTHKEDIDTLVSACLKLSYLFRTKSFRQHGIKYSKPVKLCKKFKFDSPKYYECLVKKYSIPGYHAVGTCKMGKDKEAVVSPTLQVHGVDRLRIIDASVMPTLPSANTFAATVMIAEKGSDLIKQYWLKR